MSEKIPVSSQRSVFSYPTLTLDRARLELELSEQPALVTKLPVTLQELLRQALASHRYALRIGEENADVLFNTAQVMVSLAENIGESVPRHSEEAVALLQEALELLNVCFTRQEMLLEEQSQNFETETEDPDDENGGVQLNPQEPGVSDATTPTESDVEEQSVTIQVPVTHSDLLDTARASLSALTLLVSLDGPLSLPTLASMAHSLSDDKIPQYLAQLSPEEKTQVQPEIALERASFVAALATADHAAHNISTQDFLTRLSVFESLVLTARVADICTYADTLVEFTTTIQSSSSSKQPLEQTAWTQLTKAQDLYGRAVKLDDPEAKDRKAAIYESRGDVEMLRFRLASEDKGALAANIRASAPLLIKNAQTYYRGATTLFRNAGDEDAAGKTAVRMLVAGKVQAMFEGKGSDELVQEVNGRRTVAVQVVADMIAEGLLHDGWFDAVFNA